MNYIIKDNTMEVAISTLGAELQSIKDNKLNHEYLWHGDAKFWGGRAPILFPIVGGLKNKEYLLNGQKYSMPNHGIIRTNEFTSTQISEKEVQFTFVATEESKKMYPFDFKMDVFYRLENHKIYISHRITNMSTENMPCVFGLHPAFNLDDKIENSYIELEDEKLISTIDNKDGFMIAKETNHGVKNLKFDTHTFDKDNTLIFENLKSRQATLRFQNSPRTVKLNWNDDLPLLAIWSKAGAPYVCIEPWCGWADNLDDTINELSSKKGMVLLAPNQVKEYNYTIEVS